jgi:initiation factor 1A
MVKNTTGGNRSKGLARKNESGQHYSKLRMAECEEEHYAIVKKIFGGTRCEVFCDDSVARQAIIRGKFTGKNKRRNIIGAGTIILVGLRDWATKKENKIEECDVLEVYSLLEVDQLKQRPTFPTDFLDTAMRELFGSSRAGEKKDEFVISFNEEFENKPTSESVDTVLMETGEEISIDDI